MQLPYEPVCPWVGWLVAWSVCNNGGKLHFLASIESLVFNVTRWKIVGRLRLRTHIYSFCISNLRSVGQTDRRNDGMTDRQTDGRPAKWTPISSFLMPYTLGSSAWTWVTDCVDLVFGSFMHSLLHIRKCRILPPTGAIDCISFTLHNSILYTTSCFWSSIGWI